MNLNQLYYFRKLAELQHYTKAAKELYISQPSLSYTIANLEEEIGTALFQKKGRNVVLTSQGEEFYQCIVEVLTKLEQGVAKIKQCEKTDKITIGIIHTLASYIIPKNIKNYIDTCPQTTFDLYTCNSNNEVISNTKDGIYDIGFGYKVENVSNLNFFPLLKQELVVITKKDHELSKKEKVSLSTLQEYPLITYRKSNPLGIAINNLFKAQGITPNIIFSFDDDFTISEMISHDFVIGLLLNTPILKNYNLSVIPLDAASTSLILYLIYQKNKNYSQTINNFIHLLKTSATSIKDQSINE